MTVSGQSGDVAAILLWRESCSRRTRRRIPHRILLTTAASHWQHRIFGLERHFSSSNHETATTGSDIRCRGPKLQRLYMVHAALCRLALFLNGARDRLTVQGLLLRQSLTPA